MNITIGPTSEMAENIFSYGVLIDNRVSSTSLIRVGNQLLHATLPIQSAMRSCLLLDNGIVNYYLSLSEYKKQICGWIGWIKYTNSKHFTKKYIKYKV